MLTHKFHSILMGRLSVALVTFAVPICVFAQSTPFPANAQQGIATVMVYIISGLNLLTWIFFILATILLDPDFIFGTVDSDKLVLALNSIWILARDLMNIGFALALIGAAVYTVVTAKKDFVVAHMKMFVLAVVLVNFSWFIPRVIIDIGNVAAATMYGIPSLLVTEGSADACSITSNKDWTEDGLTCEAVEDGMYKCKCAAVTNARFFVSTGVYEALDKGAGWYCPLGNVVCVKLTDLDVKAVAGYSAVLNGLIINHARLISLAVVPPSEAATDIQALIVFLMKEGIVLVIHIALLFPLAAIVLAFAIRIPILWLTIAFMPFALLKFAVPDKITGGLPQKIWDNFLIAAFLPAMVAAPLAVGFILVNAGVNFTSGITPELLVFGKSGFRIGPISNFYELLWLGMSLAVLYGGVFMVLKDHAGPIMGWGSNFIEGLGKSLGGIAIKTPLASIPILPGPAGTLPSGRKMNVFDIPPALSSMNRSPVGFADIIKDLGSSAEKGHIDNAAQRLAKNDGEEFNKFNDNLRQIIQEMRTNPDRAKDKLRELGNNYNISINKNNPTAALSDLHEALRRHHLSQTQLSDLNTRMDEIRTALSPTPQNPPPPTTPPPTGTPPSPPAATNPATPPATTPEA